MKRDTLINEIEANNQKIEAIKNKNYDLLINLIQMSDDLVQYSEKEEVSTVKQRPKKVENHLIGRINWVEHFKDEDRNTTFPIKRSCIVRVDGEWQIPAHILKVIKYPL